MKLRLLYFCLGVILGLCSIAFTQEYRHTLMENLLMARIAVQEIHINQLQTTIRFYRGELYEHCDAYIP